ncbi:BACON domain-containing protein [Dawidia soli]|uniref:BACON domain-containing protein n=1 Tax=Dawidia soli TaxID=2782352 RepID=A0AAP2GKR6_9BACT|nr:BACON domain-containing protein [Dawidia soli]MBT1689318.1 BACON domain-containing protein [Dawidia soli]
MKSTIHFRSGYFAAIVLAMVAVLPLLLVSCSDDEEEFSGDPYFSIDDAPTGLTAGVEGSTVSYVVRSNRPWQIVAQEENSWVRAFPAEGSEDGTFKLIVGENETFDARTMNFSFIVAGEEQPVLFRVEQAANVPYINLPGAQTGAEVLAAGGDITIDVDANVAWTYTLEDDATWLTQLELSATKIRLRAEKNSGTDRSTTVTVRSATHPELDKTIVITQLPGNIILREDFSWLAYGSEKPYNTTGETRFDTWTQDQLNHGWFSTPVAASSNQPLLYARQGFVKLGKTGFGGDLISPRLNIEGTVDIRVTFKAAAYISAGGAIDDRILKIYALGAGTPSTSQLSIDNVPNSEAQDNAGVVNNIWAAERAYSFTVTGATADTQIKFLGGDYNLTGVGQGKNRIFIDDINIEIIE